ncbi:MAG: hypothetical protein ICV64_11530 [Thermoleophilia bacterium]|nr:hypothetical protein [Thermoleophilia bacterium]
MGRAATRLVRLAAATAALVAVAAQAGTAAGGPPAAGGVVHAHPRGVTIPFGEYGPDVLRYGARPAAATAAVGTVRNWLSLDDRENRYYAAPFRLAGVGQHVEVWVATDLSFPASDCRNQVDGGGRVTVTPEQAAHLVQAFDRAIYPRLSNAFSVPPPREGTQARADPFRFDPRGDGDDIVVLVENVRDTNYYDFDNRGNVPYIAGFFARDLVDFFDRNVLTIDAYDWLHRTGADPPHHPAPGDLCASAPARPHLYESTLAHEYQHLLQYYEDPDEVNWVDEGLSDLAQRIAGFSDARRTIHQRGFDTHVQCFLGWLGVQTDANPNPRPGGPENSLNRWSEHAGEILCDYGAAYTFMEVLAGRYGVPFIRALHREDADGFDGLRRVLRARGVRASVPDLVADWGAVAALDAVLDGGARFAGPRARYRTPALRASVNWAEPRADNPPGAPPNGSDFVRLRDRGGRFLHARQLRSLRFTAPGGSFTLQLLSYRTLPRGRAALVRIPLRGRRAALGRQELRRLLGTNADVAAAIVTAHDPSGTARAYARYRLTVNGVRQPGG